MSHNSADRKLLTKRSRNSSNRSYETGDLGCETKSDDIEHEKRLDYQRNQAKSFQFSSTSVIPPMLNNKRKSAHLRNPNEILEGEFTNVIDNNAEIDFQLLEFNENIESILFYCDFVLGFCYVLLFGSTLPGLSFLSLVDILLICYSNAYRLIHLYQRSCTYLTTSIGSWFLIMNWMLTIAYVTNSALIVFTMTTLKFISFKYR